MHAFVAPVFAASSHHHWGNLLWCCAGIAVFLAALALFGRWAGATHPAPIPRPELPAPQPIDEGALPPHVVAAIAAAVQVTLGSRARITDVVPAKAAPVSVEGLMLTWSLEGRRQIYTSHRVR